MDTFFEQIISIKKSGKTVAAFIGIWSLALLLSLVALMLLGSFSLLIIAGVLFGAYKLSSLLNVEYEYIVTNGTMDVDKIINKSSRKRILSFELSSVTRLEKFNPSLISSVSAKDLTVACNAGDPDAYLMVSSPEGKGTSYLVFAPEERLRGAIVKFIPKFIANSAFQ